MNHYNQFNAKDASKKKSEEAAEENKKSTPEPVAPLAASRSHGATADFAMKETLDKIYAKIESAKRKQDDLGLRKR